MKKLSLILMTGAISAVLSIGLTGCGIGNTPQPYNYKMSKKYQSISDYEKQQLLNIVVNRNSRLKYKSSNGCISVTSIIWGYSTRYDDRMKNCFKVNNNHITRIDYSKCKTGYKTQKCNYIGRKVENYSDFINKLQSNNILSNGLNNELINYQKFIVLYNKADKQRKDKISKVKTSLLDNTGVLSQSVFNKFNKFKTNSISTKSKIYLYKSYIAPKDGENTVNQFARNILGDSFSENFDKVFNDGTILSNDFKVQSYVLKNEIGRYKVNYKKTLFKENYDVFPTNIIFEIDKVYFNYLPSKYLAYDKNIDIEVINTALTRGSIKSIKIQNKTKEFIEIDTIAGYYGENVTDNIINIKDMKRVKIAPMSYKIFKTGYSYKYRINDFPSKKLLLVDNKNQKINYGFSVGYKMVNQNIIKNVYKVNSYSIKDFQ